MERGLSRKGWGGTGPEHCNLVGARGFGLRVQPRCPFDRPAALPGRHVLFLPIRSALAGFKPLLIYSACGLLSEAVLAEERSVGRGERI